MSSLDYFGTLLIKRETILSERKLQLEEKLSLRGSLLHQRKLMQQAIDFILSLSDNAQRTVFTFVEDLLTSGVQDVFDPSWQVELKLVTRGGRQSIVIYLHQGDVVVEVPDGVGGGVQQVISVLLLFAVIYLLRGRQRLFVVLDEPFAHLDSNHVGKMVAVLRSLVERYGFEVLIVTHQRAVEDVSSLVYRFELIDSTTLIERLR